MRQLASKKWQARVSNPEGKQVALGTFRLKKEAEDAIREYESRFKGANHAENLSRYRALEKAKVTTFGDLAKRYIENRQLSPRTKELYASYQAKYLLEFLEQPIRTVTQEQIEDWWREFGDETASQRQKVYGYLHSVMKYAVELDYIDRNPCRIPRGFARLEPKFPKLLPTEEQVRQIIALTEWGGERLAYIIAFNAGLRKGEMLELRRKDLEFDKERNRYLVKVERSVSWLRNGEVKVGVPKANSKRVVPLSKNLNEDIKALLSSLGTIDPEALIYPADRALNTHLRNHANNRRFDKYRKAVGYGGKFHDARAFVNSNLLKSGATLKEALDRLGHKTLQANAFYQRGLGREDELADNLPSLK